MRVGPTGGLGHHDGAWMQRTPAQFRRPPLQKDPTGLLDRHTAGTLSRSSLHTDMWARLRRWPRCQLCSRTRGRACAGWGPPWSGVWLRVGRHPPLPSLTLRGPPPQNNAPRGPSKTHLRLPCLFALVDVWAAVRFGPTCHLINGFPKGKATERSIGGPTWVAVRMATRSGRGAAVMATGELLPEMELSLSLGPALVPPPLPIQLGFYERAHSNVRLASWIGRCEVGILIQRYNLNSIFLCWFTSQVTLLFFHFYMLFGFVGFL